MSVIYDCIRECLLVLILMKNVIHVKYHSVFNDLLQTPLSRDIVPLVITESPEELNSVGLVTTADVRQDVSPSTNAESSDPKSLTADTKQPAEIRFYNIDIWSHLAFWPET